MSHSASIKRTISKSEFIDAIAGDTQFSILAEGEAFMVARWNNGQENAVFNLVQGEISVGSPSATALEKMKVLARQFSAEVIGDEDDLPVRSDNKRNENNGMAGFVWPALVVALLVLLIWRW